MNAKKPNAITKNLTSVVILSKFVVTIRNVCIKRPINVIIIIILTKRRVTRKLRVAV